MNPILVSLNLKEDGWLGKKNGTGWPSKGDGGLVGRAPACYGSSMGSNQDSTVRHLLDRRDRRVLVHIFTRDETGVVCLPTQLERTLQLYW
jgi:hypothetical protein